VKRNTKIGIQILEDEYRMGNTRGRRRNIGGGIRVSDGEYVKGNTSVITRVLEGKYWECNRKVESEYRRRNKSVEDRRYAVLMRVSESQFQFKVERTINDFNFYGSIFPH
jgi:hypothetical protein